MKTLIKNYVDFKISLILLTFLTIFFSIQSYSQRNCGYYEKLEELQKNAEFKIGRINFERKLQNYLKNISHNRNGDIYKIPVVVHIVLNNPNSIPNSRVYDQIDILNKDFRALNTDVTQVPSVFQSLISDTRFEFYLAEVGPDCNGITRTVTTQGRFYNDNIKKTSKKGRDPIDTEHILNIWVGTITEGVLGWTQPVGGPAETDGVVIADWCFGYTNSPSFGLGEQPLMKLVIILI